MKSATFVKMTVMIKMENGTSIPVDVDRTTHFGVHKVILSTSTDGTVEQGRSYAVTHLPSSMIAFNAKKKTTALAIAKELEAMGSVWTPEKPSLETLKQGREIIDRYEYDRVIIHAGC